MLKKRTGNKVPEQAREVWPLAEICQDTCRGLGRPGDLSPGLPPSWPYQALWPPHRRKQFSCVAPQIPASALTPTALWLTHVCLAS